MMMYSERHIENNPVIATNNELLCCENLTTAPFSQNMLLSAIHRLYKQYEFNANGYLSNIIRRCC